MNPIRLSVAGRYQDRATIKRQINQSGLFVQSAFPVDITASWIDSANENDAALSDFQAKEQVMLNMQEIADADVLLYFSCVNALGEPFWTPGRLIDFGIAFGKGKPIIIVGKPEESIYFRCHLVTSCEPNKLCETIKKVLGV